MRAPRRTVRYYIENWQTHRDAQYAYEGSRYYEMLIDKPPGGYFMDHYGVKVVRAEDLDWMSM